MTDNPLVSICIPTYNRADMVGKAIESALDQTYQNIEVIVVDNASTDNTEEIVASYDDPRLKYFGNDENVGIFGNFNRCIDLYNGDFLHILHSDDFISLDFTEKCVDFFETHPNVFLTFTATKTIEMGHMTLISKGDINYILSAPEGFKKILSNGNFISCPSVMVRNGLHERYGNFPLNYKYSGDYYQWLKISKNYDIGYICDTYLYYVSGTHSETYRLKTCNIQGYQDSLNIVSNIKNTLGSEINDYSMEINLALYRLINECISSFFHQLGVKKLINPIDLLDVAFKGWSKLLYINWKESFKKIKYLIIILFSYIIVTFYFTRCLTEKLWNSSSFQIFKFALKKLR